MQNGPSQERCDAKNQNDAQCQSLPALAPWQKKTSPNHVRCFGLIFIFCLMPYFRITPFPPCLVLQAFMDRVQAQAAHDKNHNHSNLTSDVKRVDCRWNVQKILGKKDIKAWKMMEKRTWSSKPTVKHYTLDRLPHKPVAIGSVQFERHPTLPLTIRLFCVCSHPQSSQSSPSSCYWKVLFRSTWKSTHCTVDVPFLVSFPMLCFRSFPCLDLDRLNRR